MSQLLQIQANEFFIDGLSPLDIYNKGYIININTLITAGYNLLQLNNVGLTKNDFNSMGYTTIDLKNAGFTATDLKNAGFTATDLKKTGFSAYNLKMTGFSILELKIAGYTEYELIDNQNEMNNYLKDKKFLQQLCNNTNSNGLSESGCKPIINTIKAKDSTNTQSSKFSSYVQRGKYINIYEGKIKEITMIFATPTTATIVYVPVGYVKTITLIAINQRNESDYHSVIVLTSPYTFKDLMPNTIYNITAISTYSSGNSYTEIFENVIRTINEGPPTNIRISKITNKTALITFIRPIGTPSSVNITITNKNDVSDKQYIQNITTNNYLITNLQINNTYTFLITALYSVSKNSYSATFPFTTLHEDFPTDIVFSNVNNISATISYQYTGSPLYNSIFVVNNSNAEENYEQKTLNTTITFSKLTNNVTYNVIVTSVYSSNNNFPVETINAFYILNEGPPININIQYIKGISLFFSFDNAIGNPLQYELVLTNKTYPTETPITSIINIENTRNILIGGEENDLLTSNSLYLFQLSSFYLQTNNTYIYEQTFQTLNEGIIRDFTLIKIGNSFITFNYTNPPGEDYLINVILSNPLDYKTIIIATNNTKITGLLIDASYSLIINTIYIQSNTTYTYNYPETIRTIKEGESIIERVYDITNNDYRIRFSNPYKIPDKFIFTSININNPENTIITEFTSSEEDITITGLLQNSTYITTLNTIYNSTQESYQTIPSIEIKTKGIPTNIKVGTFITDTSASITFVAPIVLPTKYILTLNERSFDISSNSIPYFVINELVPNTYYTISLGSYYEAVNNVNSVALLYNAETFNLTTKGPVQNIQLQIVTDISATIIFEPPLLEYNWKYYAYLNNIQYANNNNTYFDFNNLDPNKEYTVYIEAVYSDIETLEIQYQSFLNEITFNTNDKPNNISISNKLDTNLTLNWDILLNTPTYYSIRYYTSDINSLNNIQFQTQSNSYILTGLTPDISYTIIELSSYYSNINTTYRNEDTGLSEVIMYSAPTDIKGITLSNKSIDISFTSPLNTTPSDYYITAVNLTNNSKTDIYSLTTSPINNGSIYNYRITDLSDNANYNIFVNSIYDQELPYNLNPPYNIINKNPFNISTYGTPKDVFFTNIYTDRFTINVQPFLIPPKNCIFSFYNIRTQQTNTINGLFDTNGRFITPVFVDLNSIFIFKNNNYNITIQAIYTSTEIYTSIPKQVYTSSSPTINSNNYISTDVSAIVYFSPPFNSPSSYNYTISSNINTISSNAIVNIDNNNYYFIVYNLQPTTIYSIYLNSYYSDINTNYSSDSITIYTAGPPSNLQIIDIFNTYVDVSFINPYQCSNYKIIATPINSLINDISNTINLPSSLTLNLNNYRFMELLEDTSYNISINSIYSNFVGISNTVQIYTFKAIQIERITNITDVSAMIYVTTHPTVLPTDMSFTYTGGNTTTIIDIDNIYNSSKNNYIFIINGLLPNVKYDPFKITSYYKENNKTFISENKPFSTKGITDIYLYVTDLSATIRFLTYNIPETYYYILNNDEPVSFKPNISNIYENTYPISDLSENTNYSLKIQTHYSEDSSIYYSQPVFFCTKIIPKPNYVVSDTQIDISFTASIVPYDISYSYLLDRYTDNYPNISFIPTIVNGIVLLNIPELIPNTFYDIFKMNILYRDTNPPETYSSQNYAFNTMGSPIGASISPNFSILSFYPPLYIPDYYIITKNSGYSSKVTETDMTYLNNIYTYNIPTEFSVSDSNIKDVRISSYYVSLNKTIPVDIWTITNINDITSSINQISTDFTGKYVKIGQSPNTKFYYSSDYGKTWSDTQFSNIVVVDSSNISQDRNIKWDSTTGLKINEKYLLSSYIDSSIHIPSTPYNNPIISGNGMYIYAYTSNQVYSYAIPIVKGTAYGLSIPNKTNTSANLSFFQPTFIPDLSYDIIITNHYIPSEKYSYTTSRNENVLLTGLTQNALYDISLNTNYSTRPQTFTTRLLSAFNTKSAPIKFQIIGNPTDTSANVQFIEPIIKPDKYILTINNNTHRDITSFSKKNANGKDYNYDIQPNDISINSFIINDLSQNTYYNLTLSSFYNENENYVSNDISFSTRGYPYNLIMKNIYDTSVNVSFLPPINIIDLLDYTITCISGSTYYNTYTNKYENTIVYDLSPNIIYDIQLSTRYSNPIQTISSTIYPRFLYTKGGPTIDISFASITDMSANIKIMKFPSSIKNTPSLLNKYQLNVTNTTTNIENIMDITEIYSSDVSYVVIPSTFLSQNTEYNVSINTFYTDTIATFYSNIIKVPTQGYPANVKSDFNYIMDISARITFDQAVNPPKDGYGVYVYDINTQKPPLDINRIFYGKVDNINSYIDINVKVTDTNKGFTENTEYYVYVSSIYKVKTEGVEEDVKTNSVPIPFITAGPPINVQIVTNSITDTSANISFNTTTLNPSKYTIYIKRVDNNLITNIYDISFLNPPISYTYTLINLPKNTNLYAVVQSIYPSKILSYTDTEQKLNFTTIGPPRNIYIVTNSITDSSATIIFSSPLSTQSNIIYNANLKNVTNNSIYQINNISSPYTFTDLSSNSSYTLILQAQYNNGLYSNSNILGFNTQGIVSQILPENVTDNQATIRFSLCPNTPNSYTLNIIDGITKTIQNIVNPYTVTDLSRNTQYNVQIRSNYNSNWNTIIE
jgi:hypothetical protein